MFLVLPLGRLWQLLSRVPYVIDLQLGTDVTIGYTSHDADTVQLYLQETLTFLCYTGEASVPLNS